ncbi:glucuronoxylan 4-O-methyltransferase 3 [Prunus yedoensis var. nudiflora]|uniref:Glucuronoxylan 4-O-methyltransferase 3 n=1 Tax=Prunus yedoensis var. nudiflora TaxID=2094558 RepID=A0A314YLW2_PRUYE|nr:glucuronoxylan 4-O-methyltransferase 3 [Prunus yedoensis var. nudiflora]
MEEEQFSWKKTSHGLSKSNKSYPTLEAYHVSYDTKVHQADKLMETGMKEECKVVGDPRFSKCELALKNWPSEVYDIEWDLIMVDAPTGYFDGAPGRMSAIYTAGLLGRNREERGD